MALKGARAAARRRAREVALQALYAWQLAGAALTEEKDALAHVRTLDGWQKCDQALAEELVQSVIEKKALLERKIEPYLDRSLASLSPVERVILLIGARELDAHTETPPRVVLNEAIELGKSFGGTGGHKFVNGVLEKLARELRPGELRGQGTAQ